MVKKKKDEERYLPENYKYSPPTTNESAFQAFKTAQAQKQQQAIQDAQNGTVNFRDASKASRIQYTIPNYEPDTNKTYQWQKDLLANTKVKGARSYKDKFDALTAQMGMTPGQAQDFQRYLSWQEDSQHVDPKLNKDGSINQSQHLGYARDTMTKTDQIDNILNSLRKNETNNVIANTATDNALGQKQQEQATQNDVPTSQIAPTGIKPIDTAYNKVSDFLNTLNTKGQRMDDQFTRTLLGQKQADKQNADQRSMLEARLAKNPNDYVAQVNLQSLNDATKNATSNTDKTLNILGGFGGNTFPYIAGDGVLAAAGKVLPGAAKLITSPLGQAVAHNAISGAVGTGLDLGTKKALGEDITAKQAAITAGLNIGGGAALPLIGKAITNSLPKAQLTKLKADMGYTDYTDEAFQNALKEAYAPKGDASNVTADPTKVVPQPFEKRWNIPPQEPKAPSEPVSSIRDQLSFAQSGPAPQARGTIPQVENAPRYWKEDLQKKADELLNQIVQKPGYKPIGYYQDLWNKTATADNSVFKDQADKLLEQAGVLSRDMSTKEEDFVNQYMQQRLNEIGANHGPVDMIANKGKLNSSDMSTLMNVADKHEQALAQADQQALDYAHNHQDYKAQSAQLHQLANQQGDWGATKQLKQEYDNLRKTLDGINFTASDKENFGDIPKSFKVTGGKGIDISQATEILGFKKPEETVSYLNKLANAKKAKMGDVVTAPKGNMPSNSLNDLEQKLVAEYHAKNNTQATRDQLQKALDLIAKGKGNDASLIEEARQAFTDSNYYQSNMKLIDALQQDLEKLRNPTKEDIYQALRQPNDPQTLNHLVDVAMKDMKDFEGTRLLETLKADPRVKDAVQKLNDLGKRTAQGPSEPKVLVKPPTAPGPKPKPTPDEILRSLVQKEGSPRQSKTENVNNSQDKSNTDGLFMRLNMQQFNEHTQNPPLFAEGKPVESKTAIESIRNPILRQVNKFYENMVNKTHSAQVAHEQVLKNEIKKAVDAGNHDYAKQLNGELKAVKKYGSNFSKALQNEVASGNVAGQFLERHLTALQDALGSTKPEDMANALRYQVAKNIRWIWDNVNPEYEVGGGWEKGMVNDIVNSGVSNPKLKGFTDAMRNLTQEWRNEALNANLITKDQHEALSRNPFYVPMFRDFSPMMDNISRSLKGGQTTNKRTAGMYFLHSLGSGDAEALYKNPVDVIIQNTFSLYKNVLKSDSEQQAYKLAQLDSDHLFAREVSKKTFEQNGGIAVPTADGKKYIQLQDDLMNMIKENDLPFDMNMLGKVTSLFAGLKTRSLEYHMTGVPRDLAEGYLKSQVSNPFKYLAEAYRVTRSKNADAKKVGAYFHAAWKDGMGGVDSNKLMKEFSKQNGNIHTFNPKDIKSWKQVVSTIGKVLDMPFKPIKALGQWSDEVPRSIEVRATERNFMKQHGEEINNLKTRLGQIDQHLEQANQVTDPFDPILQGIDNLKNEKAGIEGRLNELDKDLKRETIYRGRDIMNFSRQGRSGVAKHIRQYAIFANTTTQSKDKLIRSFIERPGVTTAKTALLIAPLVAAEEVARQNMSASDKEIHDNLPWYVKQYNYTFVMGGKVITVPKIQELALLSDPIEAMLSGNKGDLNQSARQVVKEMVPYQLGNIAQGLVPNTDGSVTIRNNLQTPSTVFSPTVDVIANQKLSFNQNPISYQDVFNKKNPKANAWTMDIFKNLLGDNPRADYGQYLAQQYGGDFGKYGTNLADWLTNPSDSTKIDAVLQNLNPLQDRIYGDNKILGRQVTKNPPKKSKVTGK